ncbi:aldo/keto reductase [Chryseobacterium oryzae]|uniref:Aldo/keto reductase n=1 Tax=Chryseobacterium oryzae TaxID=2929799 RepID=A0ABY4BHY8_9FLAO|nr:aldo/keto reductase [Chryseobacterium oryzae]UOE37556.1 aldo/keto reductase [Chryseobacterium oryzae]
MKFVTLKNRNKVPALGQGCWKIGDHPNRRQQEIDTLRRGVELGMTLIDTAEYYGNGRSEDLISEAIEGMRDDIYLVSKVMPSNASYQGTIAACERSLGHLKTDRLDMYLLHWQGSYPVEETVRAFEKLVADGKILNWGVSNFDVQDLEDVFEVPNGKDCATNQVFYNLSHRGIEYDMFPWAKEEGIPLMAYSPIDESRLVSRNQLQRVADNHNATPAQIALAWSIQSGIVISIPKASTVAHVEDNAKAADIILTAEDNAILDAAFPPPHRKVNLEFI